jgi:hypothetical protein
VGGDHIKWDMDFKKDSIKGFPNLAQLSFAKPTHLEAQETKKKRRKTTTTTTQPKKFPKKHYCKTISKLSGFSSNPS